MKRSFVFFLGLSLASALPACDFVENQRDLQPERWQAANPAPRIGNPREQNQRHRLLIALLDSGTDYLHPELEKNVHLDLDEKGKPRRWGWDYVGNDGWPGPRLGRSRDVNPEAALKDRLFSEQLRKMYEDGIRLVPELADFLNPGRQHELEKNMFHGTHVAGLMTYDREDLGLLAYRVLPFNKKENEGFFPDFSAYRDETAEVLEQALSQAVKDGARVVNLSLGMGLTAACLKQGFENEKCPESDRRIFFRLRDIIRASKDVVFVAAAGNDGKTFEGQDFLPCGFEAENLICVGALKNRREKADFSNIPLKHKNFVFAPGFEIQSLRPTGICHSPSLPGNIEAGGYFHEPESERKKLWEQALKDCRREVPYVQVSGTSMASPLIARQIAIQMINAPHRTGAQTVRDFFEKTQSLAIEGTIYRRFEVEIPSWMSRQGHRLYKPASIQTIPLYLLNETSI